MARRITMNDLEALRLEINLIFKENIGEIGSFFISQANGGVNLCRLTEGYGASDPITSGHKPKRELYNQMLGFIRLHDLLNSK